MNTRLKILEFVPELELAGAEIMVEHLSTKLMKKGHDVQVISLYNLQSPITERLEKNGVLVRYLDKKPGFDIKIFPAVYALLKEERPDVVHTHRYILPYVMPAAILARIRCRVHTVHNIADKEVSPLMQKVNWFFYRFLNVIPVSISPLIRESIRTRYRIKLSNIPMVFNGIPPERFGSRRKVSYEMIGDGPRLLHIGRFSEQKNHQLLIDIFKRISDVYDNARLQLIGSGELMDSVRAKVIELGLKEQVDFLGLQSDVTGFLAAADVFVLPSLYEGMPITLIEAMMCGLPITASRVGGIPDMIDNGVSGMLSEVETEALTNCVLRLLESEDLRKSMGTEAIARSVTFSDEMMVEGYLRIYNEVLDG